jgi:hypothetical protein
MIVSETSLSGAEASPWVSPERKLLAQVRLRITNLWAASQAVFGFNPPAHARTIFRASAISITISRKIVVISICSCL